MVLDILESSGINGFVFEGIVPAPSSSAYRNKCEFSFGDSEKDGDLALGMRKRAAFTRLSLSGTAISLTATF